MKSYFGSTQTKKVYLVQYTFKHSRVTEEIQWEPILTVAIHLRPFSPVFLSRNISFFLWSVVMVV